MKFKKITIFLFLIFFLFSCTGAKDALQGKKRADQSDEFLVEKKNPLTTPPDFEELPVPIDEENTFSENKKKENIKNLLKENSTKTDSNNKNNEENSLEKTILEKINN